MRSVFSCALACLIALSLVNSLNPNKMYQNGWLFKDLYDGFQFATKESRNSNLHLVKESEEIGPVLHDYIVATLRQNTLKALRKLTQNWKVISRRSAKQGKAKAEETVVALRDVIARSESTFETIGSGFKMADTILQSFIGILRVAVGRPWPLPSQAKLRDSSATSGIKKTKDNKSLNADYFQLQQAANNLRDRTYSDQLGGALSILVGLRNGDQESRRIPQETIKSTVDYVLDAYIATNGQPQALFLPQIFEGIPIDKESVNKL